MLQGLLNFANIQTLLFLVVGTAWGMLAGALPGISASLAVILILPFTYSMGAVQSIIALVAVYVGGMCGGSISAILLRTPGTPSAVVTVFDGYPMAQKGQAGKALGLAIAASAVGGIVSGIAMVIFAPLLSKAAMKFQSGEFFALGLLGLSCTASMATKNWKKALISGCFGVLISTIGLDYMSGANRFTFDTTWLADGIDFVPVMIGAYAFAEVYRNILKKPDPNAPKADVSNADMAFIGIGHILKHWVTYLKSSVIGTVVGIIPAAGGSIASFISYGEAVRSSKHPETFGKGEELGIVASEAANNAAVGGSLVPTICLGIPGGTVTAIMLSAFTMHGLVAGPTLIRNQPDLLFSILWAIVFSSLLLYVIGKILAKQFAKVSQLDYSIVGAMMLVLGIVGSYTLKGNVREVAIMLVFSLIGLVMEHYGYSVATMILGLVLGPITEKGFRKQLIISRGDWTIFFRKPICLIILIIAVVSFCMPFIRNARKKKAEDAK
ncbi:MAG: tripartite tricarboxylate transporter permease [Clostridiales bacterium]|nr:tripartite tricarboxylate transporter permease [Clostridiales bacterium]